MPELPEVETIVRGLRPHVKGRRIGAARHSRLLRALPSRAAVRRGLPRKRVTRLRRRGKYFLADLDSGATLMVHLGMTGQLLLEPPRERPRKHMHLAVRFSGLKAELRFYDPRRFGRVALGRMDQLAGWTGLGKLGIEPLDSREDRIAEAIRSRDKRLKALLLEGSAVAGLGNIYADEALFRAGIHPERVASSLDPEQALRLASEIRAVLRESLRSGGSTIGDYVRHDGRAGGFQDEHLVYGREGEPCPRCGRKIFRLDVAGRSTHVCTRCQKPPRKR
ncbi:MAG: bifunctional DNA-formamidopyrimidine glycosylase/DNA-(apurinic or apyrimidinic site) lyase [Planctomycetota bacterium]